MKDITKLRFIVGWLGVASVLWVIGTAVETWAQPTRPPRPGTIEPASPSTPPRPGSLETDTPAPPPPAQGKVTRIVIPPTKGFLILFTTAQSNVVLRKLGRRGPQGESYKPEDKGGGILIFKDLPPVRYRLEILRDKHEKLADTIDIKAGQPTVLNALLIPHFAVVRLTMGELAAPDVKVKLDERELKPEELKIEKDAIIINEVRIGVHKLAISKARYRDWAQEQLQVKPGDNVWDINLQPASVALTIATFKGARVYISQQGKEGKVDKGVVGEDGALVISDLLPQPYDVSVELFGYQPDVRRVTLELDKPQRLNISLISLTKRNDGKDGFDPEKRVWFPMAPADWHVEKNDGMLVRGKGSAFFRDHDQPTLNIYENYTMVLRVKLSNTLGASWIIRAQDEKNYYLFELTTSRSREKERYLIFSIVRDGKPKEVHRDPVVIDIEHPTDTLTIQLEDKDGEIRHRITAPSDPRVGAQALGQRFSNDTFKKGGVGLCAVNGLEMYISQFLVAPDNKR